MRLSQALSTMTLAFLPWFARACDLTQVQIVQSVGRVGKVSVDFGQADDARHPTAWQGPLQISVVGARECSVSDEVSVVEGPVLMGGDVLFVPTYSGSNNHLYAIDVKTCKIIWHSGRFAGKTVLKKRRLLAGSSEVAIDRHCRPSAAGGE